MTSNEIRQRFLDFFVAREHRAVRSSSLVPANDPTLLFTNAGMNQFKDVFLGREKRDYVRACTSQKCVRAGGKHNDLEQVGRTTRHHTFFEMLGNFSFGDYFKEKAIPWAWELVTREFALPREKLYVTVFRDDDEAEQIWARDVGVPRDRIFRMDEKDNFWAMGETGPCGPCSEIHYDLGPTASEEGHQNCAFPCECGRYVELWNLVFMQYNRDEQGNLTPLPRPSIDTGAGLERLAAVLQGKLSNFDTDLFRPLIDEAAGLANIEYGSNHDRDVSLRIIADHARAATFLISDGVLPSNEGRGYVLRLILRRALYHGQTLGLSEPFMFKLAGLVVDLMKAAYPELSETAPHVAKAIKIEEVRYAHTTKLGLEHLAETRVLDAGTGRFRKFSEVMTRAADMAGKDWVIPGSELFLLHGTYGLRPDFVESIVRTKGVRIDLDGYKAAMDEERERARASWKAAEKKIVNPFFTELAEKRSTTFDGYRQIRSENCEVLALLVKGEPLEKVPKGAHVEIVLDHTPFYAESGGQVGDTGQLISATDGRDIALVQDTYSPVSGLIVHRALATDELRVGMRLTARVDTVRRAAIRRNHTATHLLHAALRKTLGTHVKQAGSLVAPDRLRFDFTHYAALDEQDLLDLEDLVNERILANVAVQAEEKELDAAVDAGAMALFGEKYADRVRVISVDDFSQELCGGTHVSRTGDIGLFKIVSEGSVAAGIRRIEAVTGTGVLETLRQSNRTIRQLAEVLRAKPDDLLSAAERLAEAEKKLRKELDAQKLKRAAAQAGDLVAQAREVNGVRVIATQVDALERPALRQMVDELRGRLVTGVIVLASVAEEKVALIAAVTKDLTNRVDAGKIVKAAATVVGGSGGGRKDLAEAGGKEPAKVSEALQTACRTIEQMLSV